MIAHDLKFKGNEFGPVGWRDVVGTFLVCAFAAHNNCRITAHLNMNPTAFAKVQGRADDVIDMGFTVELNHVIDNTNSPEKECLTAGVIFDPPGRPVIRNLRPRLPTTDIEPRHAVDWHPMIAT
jgi:hypothetical protein